LFFLLVNPHKHKRNNRNKCYIFRLIFTTGLGPYINPFTSIYKIHHRSWSDVELMLLLKIYSIMKNQLRYSFWQTMDF